MYTITVYDGSIMGRATIADALEVALEEMIGNHGYEVEVFDTLTNAYLFRFERKFKYHYTSGFGVIADETIEATIYPALADAIVAEQNRLTDSDLRSILTVLTASDRLLLTTGGSCYTRVGQFKDDLGLLPDVSIEGEYDKGYTDTSLTLIEEYRYVLNRLVQKLEKQLRMDAGIPAEILANPHG